MKLAESWTEDAPTGTALESFHDEVEEHDEVDEAKDGCGGGVVAAVCINKDQKQQQITPSTCERNSRCGKEAWQKINSGSVQSDFR